MGPEGGTSVTVEITPRSAYFAKSCPQRVQLDVLWPCEPLPDAPFLQKLVESGHEYEEETVAGLLEGVEGVTVVEAEDPEAREWHTTRALADGARIVAGGRLPVDYEAHRVGEPDLLVRSGDGYLAVDVKSHKILEAAKEPGAGTALVSELDEPYVEAAVTDPDRIPRRNHLVKDLLQLAHYRRLLECADLAPSGPNLGGICGSEGVIVWYDLDEPQLEAPEHVPSAPAGPLSAMARYDLEFAHRLGVHVAAEAHADDATAPLLAEPVVCEQCDMCRWRAWCGDRLEEVADLSLLSGVGVARRRLYQDHGVGDLHALARLDWTTAELCRAKVDLADLLAKAEGLPVTTPLADVVTSRKKQLEALATRGFVTVGDLAAVDRATLDLAAAGATNLAAQIDLARARTGPSAAYRPRGAGPIEVPRADIEVDVDMENTLEGCYLWGVLVTDRRGPAPATSALSFATWDPDLESGQLVAFKDFWTWFSAERERAHAEGLRFAAYCYAKSAEEGQMKPLADALGVRAEVDEFLASDEWVDLLEVVRRSLVTGRSMGLKETARLAGFAWRSDETGGTLAMVNHDVAVDDSDPALQAEARQWILEYNQDDVRANAAVREWLDTAAGALPSIADLGH